MNCPALPELKDQQPLASNDLSCQRVQTLPSRTCVYHTDICYQGGRRNTLAGLCVQCCCHWGLHIKYCALKKLIVCLILFQWSQQTVKQTTILKNTFPNKSSTLLSVETFWSLMWHTPHPSPELALSPDTTDAPELGHQQQQVSSHPWLTKYSQFASLMSNLLLPQQANEEQCDSTWWWQHQEHPFPAPEREHDFWSHDTGAPSDEPAPPNSSHSKKPCILKPPPVVLCTMRWIPQDTHVALAQH